MTRDWASISARVVVAGVLCLCILAASVGVCAAGEAEPPEYHVKAVFLHNFAKFVAWPREAMGKPGDPIRIGVLEADRFGDAFALLKDARAKGRPVTIQECPTISELEKCHIIFLGSHDELLVRVILQHFRDKPVLTVGEGLNFNRWHGMISFVERKGRVGLRVSLEDAKKAKLKISAQLLEVAELYERGGR